jgi:hypothetical protein
MAFSFSLIIRRASRMIEHSARVASQSERNPPWKASRSALSGVDLKK